MTPDTPQTAVSGPIRGVRGLRNFKRLAEAHAARLVSSPPDES